MTSAEQKLAVISGIVADAIKLVDAKQFTPVRARLTSIQAIAAADQAKPVQTGVVARRTTNVAKNIIASRKPKPRAEITAIIVDTKPTASDTDTVPAPVPAATEPHDVKVEAPIKKPFRKIPATVAIDKLDETGLKKLAADFGIALKEKNAFGIKKNWDAKALREELKKHQE